MQNKLKSKKKFTIIIPCYNSDKFLKKCLNSIFGQIKNDNIFNVLIIDDGSTDNSEKIIKKYLKQHKFCQYIKTKNNGLERALNLGVSLSQTKFIIRMDSDDYFSPSYFEYLKNTDFKDTYFYYFNYNLINENGKLIKKISLPEFDIDEIRMRGDFLASGIIYPKIFFTKHGNFTTINKNCGLENYEYILRLIDFGVNGMLINKVLFNYRRHKKNITSTKLKEIILFGQQLFDKKKLGKYRTNKYHPYGLVL